MAKMNKTVVRRMIKRIESIPASFDQKAWGVSPSNEAPCGSAACLAGEAVICSVANPVKGLALAEKLGVDMFDEAGRLLGLKGIEHAVFAANASGWPQPYRSQINKRTTNEGKARVAAAYLKEALKRGTMVWEATT